MTVGEKIRAMRKSKGMTLAQLASKLDVTSSAISQYERGKLTPSLSMLLRMSVVFDCSLQAISTEKEVNEDNYSQTAITPSIIEIVANPCSALDLAIEKMPELAKDGLYQYTKLSGLLGSVSFEGIMDIVRESNDFVLAEISFPEVIALCKMYERMTAGGKARTLEYMADLLHAPKFQNTPINTEELARYADYLSTDDEEEET